MIESVTKKSELVIPVHSYKNPWIKKVKTWIYMHKYNAQLIEGSHFLSAGISEFDRGHDVFIMHR